MHQQDLARWKRRLIRLINAQKHNLKTANKLDEGYPFKVCENEAYESVQRILYKKWKNI
jgi:hypothetical protein